jgi:hypothetical protein
LERKQLHTLQALFATNQERRKSGDEEDHEKNQEKVGTDEEDHQRKKEKEPDPEEPQGTDVDGEKRAPEQQPPFSWNQQLQILERGFVFALGPISNSARSLLKDIRSLASRLAIFQRFDLQLQPPSYLEQVRRSLDDELKRRASLVKRLLRLFSSQKRMISLLLPSSVVDVLLSNALRTDADHPNSLTRLPPSLIALVSESLRQHLQALSELLRGSMNSLDGPSTSLLNIWEHLHCGFKALGCETLLADLERRLPRKSLFDERHSAQNKQQRAALKQELLSVLNGNVAAALAPQQPPTSPAPLTDGWRTVQRQRSSAASSSSSSSSAQQQQQQQQQQQPHSRVRSRPAVAAVGVKTAPNPYSVLEKSDQE